MKSTALLSLIVVVLFTPRSMAEEKNGLMITAGKKTLDRSDSRGYYTRTTEKTQALKVTIKNITFRDMPEGTLEWTVLTRPYYGRDRYKYVGTEKVKALKKSETAEIVVPLPQVTEYRGVDSRKDDTVYQLIVMHGDEEMVRLETGRDFDLLAQTATLMKGPTTVKTKPGLKTKSGESGMETEEVPAEEPAKPEKPVVEAKPKEPAKPVSEERVPPPAVDFFKQK